MLSEFVCDHDSLPSVGCQDCLEYADREKHKSTPVDGYILLNPVSDRETASLLMSPEDLGETIQYAQQMIGEGKEKDAMPVSLIPPSTCKVLVGFRPWDNAIFLVSTEMYHKLPLLSFSTS